MSPSKELLCCAPGEALCRCQETDPSAGGMKGMGSWASWAEVKQLVCFSALQEEATCREKGGLGP